MNLQKKLCLEWSKILKNVTNSVYCSRYVRVGCGYRQLREHILQIIIFFESCRL